MIVMSETAETLTDALFCLDEPWRSRFLVLLARWATRGAWDGRAPQRDKVVTWLGTDPNLHREMFLLLRTWCGSDM